MASRNRNPAPSPEESANRLARWLESAGPYHTSVDVARSGASAYVEIWAVDEDGSPADRIAKVRLSDHSAELSSYHWGSRDDVDFDVVLRGGDGSEHADGHTASDAALWLAARLGIAPPAWALRHKAKADKAAIRRQQMEAERHQIMQQWEGQRAAAHQQWLASIPTDVRDQYTMISSQAAVARGKRRKRLREKLRAIERAHGMVWPSPPGVAPMPDREMNPHQHRNHDPEIGMAVAWRAMPNRPWEIRLFIDGRDSGDVVRDHKTGGAVTFKTSNAAREWINRHGHRWARRFVKQRTSNPRRRNSEYHGAHRPASPDFGAPMHDVNDMMPDYYAHPEWYYHRSFRAQDDHDAAAIIRTVQDRPWAGVWIYRAVPKDVKRINPGDWVTQVRGYAKDHLESNLLGRGHIIKAKVYAGDLYTEGSSHLEWGWHPKVEGYNREYEAMKRAARSRARTSNPASGQFHADLRPHLAKLARDPALQTRSMKEHLRAVSRRPGSVRAGSQARREWVEFAGYEPNHAAKVDGVALSGELPGVRVDLIEGYGQKTRRRVTIRASQKELWLVWFNSGERFALTGGPSAMRELAVDFARLGEPVVLTKVDYVAPRYPVPEGVQRSRANADMAVAFTHAVENPTLLSWNGQRDPKRARFDIRVQGPRRRWVNRSGLIF